MITLVNKVTETTPKETPNTTTPTTWPYQLTKTSTIQKLRQQRQHLHQELSNNIFLTETQQKTYETELYKLDTQIAHQHGAHYHNHPTYGGNSWGYLPIDNPDQPLTTNPTWIINHGAYEVGRLATPDGKLLLDGHPINKKDTLWYGTTTNQTTAATVWANRARINKKLIKLGYKPVYNTNHENYPTIEFTLTGKNLKGLIQPTEGQNENIVPFLVKVRKNNN